MKSFFTWFFEPLDEYIKANKPSITISIEQEKEPLVISKTIGTSNYRPSSFVEYIGQEKTKDNLKIYIDNMKKRNKIMPHTVIWSNPGMGKTTLARIIANELGVKFYEILSSKVSDIDEVVKIIKELNGGVLFLDEIQSLDRATAELFYPIMEDFKIGDEVLPKFTLIGATTEIGEILSDRKPFFDRFEIQIELEDYSYDDIECIMRKYLINSFPEESAEIIKRDDEIIKFLAKNSRRTPRRAISLLKNCIYSGLDTKRTLSNNRIVKEGITENDIKILKLLQKFPKGLGVVTLSACVDMNTRNYLEQYERFLMKEDYIMKGNKGRQITEKGIKFLGEII